MGDPASKAWNLQHTWPAVVVIDAVNVIEVALLTVRMVAMTSFVPALMNRILSPICMPVVDVTTCVALVAPVVTNVAAPNVSGVYEASRTLYGPP